MFTRHPRWASQETATGTVVPFRAHRQPIVAPTARRVDDEGPSATSSPSPRAKQLLAEEDLRAIESTYADGITMVQIVDIFTSRGIKFSEASFRKYVQQNLLPRSRRVGRKGKHKGSLGVYPTKTIRRINSVKQLMLEGFTIEQIQGQFLLYTDLVENVSDTLSALWTQLDADAAKAEPSVRKSLERELVDARRDGDRLVDRLGELSRRIAAPKTNDLRLAGAAGGAEDLL